MKLHYAMNAVLELASVFGVKIDGVVTRMRLSDVADNQSLPLVYAEKVFSALRSGGIVSAFRGPGGGYALSRDPCEVTVGDVIDALGCSIQLNKCGGVGSCVVSAAGRRCCSHDFWCFLSSYIGSCLYNMTIADVLQNKFGDASSAFRAPARFGVALSAPGGSLLKVSRPEVEDLREGKDSSREIYLDYNATAPVSDVMIEKACGIMKNYCGANPSSLYGRGQRARHGVNSVRDKLKDVLNLSNDERMEVVFTASGTEANNLAIKGLGNEYMHIVSPIEHMSVLESVPESAVKLRVDDNGVVCVDNLKDILLELAKHSPSKGFCVSVMMANHETGVIQPIREIAKIVHKRGGVLHVDAVQALGRLKLDMRGLGIDLLTVSSHKIGGIVGVGALVYDSSKIKLKSIIDGGKQEKGLRAGTENVLAILVFGEALAGVESMLGDGSRLANMRDRFEELILSSCPDAKVFGLGVSRLSNTTYVCMPGVKNYVQLIHFDRVGIAVSVGSACSSGSVTSSHVLLAMGVDPSDAECAIRVSFGVHNTEHDVDVAAGEWLKIYERSKGLGVC